MTGSYAGHPAWCTGDSRCDLHAGHRSGWHRGTPHPMRSSDGIEAWMYLERFDGEDDESPSRGIGVDVRNPAHPHEEWSAHVSATDAEAIAAWLLEPPTADVSD